jgi:hypothetical protein
MAEESNNSNSSFDLDVINNYKGVMLCSRPNEKKSVDVDKYFTNHLGRSAEESYPVNRSALIPSRKI